MSRKNVFFMLKKNKAQSTTQEVQVNEQEA
ncbi:hypothetical protein PQC38_gp027 [Aeromonas phage BUCT695]|nr:hypothetical protein PQC38_gp027 [Aeromonas phage BUCT695]UIW10503.1 hypothetical protein [Aeromonas phage BUCT695]